MLNNTRIAIVTNTNLFFIFSFIKNIFVKTIACSITYYNSQFSLICL